MAENDSEQPGTGTGTGTGTTNRGARASVGPVYFEHERLDVYRVAKEFKELAAAFTLRKMPSDLRSQFDRSTTSITANIGEGAGRTAKADKRRFYEMARGSTTETATHLDVLHIRKIISDAEFQQARKLLARVAMMLIRLSGQPRKT